MFVRLQKPKVGDDVTREDKQEKPSDPVSPSDVAKDSVTVTQQVPSEEILSTQSTDAIKSSQSTNAVKSTSDSASPDPRPVSPPPSSVNSDVGADVSVEVTVTEPSGPTGESVTSDSRTVDDRDHTTTEVHDDDTSAGAHIPTAADTDRYLLSFLNVMEEMCVSVIPF